MAASLPPNANLSLIPFSPSPDGSPPNFSDSAPSLATTLLATGNIFAAIASIAVCIRLFIGYTNRFHWDDAFSVLALALSHVYLGEVCTNHLPVALRHSWDVPLSLFDEHYIKAITVVGCVAGPCLWAARVAILLLQLRIFQPKQWFRNVTYVILFCITLIHWSNIPVFIAYCVPRGPDEGWDIGLLERCMPATLAVFIVGVLSTTFDILMLILPQRLIYQLHLSTAKKIGLALIFAEGFLATAASLVSLYYRFALWQAKDFAWNSGNVYICVLVENYTVITVGCTPALATFYRTYISPYTSSPTSGTLFSRRPGSNRNTAVSKGDVKSGLGHHVSHDFTFRGDIKHKGIQKTTQYMVTTEDRASDEVELTGLEGMLGMKPKAHSDAFK